EFQHLALGVHQLIGAAGHIAGQGGLLLFQLGLAALVFGLAGFQLGFGVVQLGFGFGQLGLGVGLLPLELGPGLVQLALGVLDQAFPAGFGPDGGDLLQAVRHRVHRGLVLVGVVVVGVRPGGLDVAGGVVVHFQGAVRDIDGQPQRAVAGGGAFGLIGK